MSMVVEASSVTEIRPDDTAWREMPYEETPPEGKKQHRWLKPLLAAGIVVIVATGGVVLFKQFRKAGETTAHKAKEMANEAVKPTEHADGVKPTTKVSEGQSSVAHHIEASRVADETHHALIQAGKELQAQARQGKKMTEQELEKIYQARRAELATTEMTEQARAQQLEELENTFSIVKNITEGIPQMQYSDEFTKQMNKIIYKTDMVNELQQFMQAGNLQEIIWRLDEAGLHDEALKFEQVLQKGMVDDYSYNYRPWRIGNNTTRKLNNGMVIYPFINLDDLIAYRLDKLLGTKVVPTTVNVDEVRLFGRHIPFSPNNTLHIERALASDADNVRAIKQDGGDILFGDKYTAYLDFIGAERVEPPPLTGEHLQRAQLLRYVTASGEAKGTYPLRGRALELEIGTSHKPSNVMDVNKLNFVGPEFIARLQEITLDDFSEVFLADKYGEGYGSYDKKAREAYDRLQAYIKAAKIN